MSEYAMLWFRSGGGILFWYFLWYNYKLQKKLEPKPKNKWRLYVLIAIAVVVFCTVIILSDRSMLNAINMGYQNIFSGIMYIWFLVHVIQRFRK